MCWNKSMCWGCLECWIGCDCQPGFEEVWGMIPQGSCWLNGSIDSHATNRSGEGRRRSCSLWMVSSGSAVGHPPLFISSFVVGKISLMPRMRNSWSLSLLDRAQLLPPAILEFIPTEEKIFRWGPFYLLSQFFWSQVLISFDSFYSW